jgi:hypothetical protein
MKNNFYGNRGFSHIRGRKILLILTFLKRRGEIKEK